MRYFRALAGGLGASGSLVAAAVVLVGVLSAVLTFHGWPSRPGTAGTPRTELSSLPSARTAAASTGATATPVALPVVPVSGSSRAAHDAARARARARRVAARRSAEWRGT